MAAVKERISALRVDDQLFVDTLGLWTSLSDSSGREGVLEFWADNMVVGKMVNTIGIGFALLCFKGTGEFNTFRKGAGEEQKVSIIWVQMEDGSDAVGFEHKIQPTAAAQERLALVDPPASHACSLGTTRA